MPNPDKPGQINFRAQLRGVRNTAHSNYGNDYFRMDGIGNDGLMINGKSADYLGVDGRLRYRAQLKAVPEGGTTQVNGDELFINGADAVSLYFAAATNFVNYKDVSGDQVARVVDTFQGIKGKSYQKIWNAAIEDYQSYYQRATLKLAQTPNSVLPTDRRMLTFENCSDPSLAALAYNFGRYLLISSSRPGTEAANLQGIWNEDQNPKWDSKYTTNINTEMNYWPAETGNLSDCAEPIITLVKELTDQGSQVAREHYGANGWVFHQNTDLWRVAAPMD
ncbi:MAG: glycoside hydrolase family 95 protein, partial [bacterium]|nr:glycoside hydrolase family 95 protein [bacterium]